MKTINTPDYLKDDSLTINLGSYVRDIIYKSKDYIEFKEDKKFILDKLLNNVKSFDSNGNKVDIELTVEQKDMVIKQYNESLKDDEKAYVENNPDEFEELFIANNYKQFAKLFPSTYIEALKEQAINHFKNDNVMEAVRYGLAYSDDIKDAISREFVNNEKFKTLLVFNNTNNILGLSQNSIKHYTNEEKKEVEKIEENKEEKQKSNPMSIFITLSGKEKETYKGIYLPVNDEMKIYIPKQLYRRNNNKLEILNNNASEARMSEYKVNPNENTKDEFYSRLSLQEFYHKYFNLYEIKMEKEVMV